MATRQQALQQQQPAKRAVSPPALMARQPPSYGDRAMDWGTEEVRQAPDGVFEIVPIGAWGQNKLPVPPQSAPPVVPAASKNGGQEISGRYKLSRFIAGKQPRREREELELAETRAATLRPISTARNNSLRTPKPG